MTYHHTAQSGTHHFAERIQLDAIQTFTIIVEHRQSLMRVHVRISMTGKVFAYGQHTTTFQSTTVSQHLFGYFLRIFTERTNMNHRIQRIGIHIRIRCKIDMHTQFTKFPCHLTSVFINQLIVFNTAQSRILWEIRCTFQTHGEPPLTVKSDHNGNFGVLLRNIRQYCLFFRRTFGKEQTSDLILLHKITYLLLFLLIRLGREGGDNQLPYFLLQVQTGKYGIYPLFATCICR